VGFEATIPEAPQKLKGLAKSYLLIKDQNIKIERFKGENSGNKHVRFLGHSTKLKHFVSTCFD